MDQKVFSRYTRNNPAGALQGSCAEPRPPSTWDAAPWEVCQSAHTHPPHNFDLASQSMSFRSDADSEISAPSRSAASTPGTASAAEGALLPQPASSMARLPPHSHFAHLLPGGEEKRSDPQETNPTVLAWEANPTGVLHAPSIPLQQPGRICPESTAMPESSAIPSLPSIPCESALRFTALLEISFDVSK